jgi:hypothetical protein
MDRSIKTRKTHYVFEYNAELDKAIKEKENSNDKKILEISHLDVKKIKVNHNGESHKFIIFYSSNNISGKNLFENPYFINRIKRDTEDVKKHLRNHLKNIGAEKDRISKIENSLCLNVTAPRPHTNTEIKIHEQYKEALNAYSEFSLAYKKAIKEKLPDGELINLEAELKIKKKDLEKFETQAFETQKSVIDEGINIRLFNSRGFEEIANNFKITIHHPGKSLESTLDEKIIPKKDINTQATTEKKSISFDSESNILRNNEKNSLSSDSSLTDFGRPKHDAINRSKITTNSPRSSRNFLNSNQTQISTISTSSKNTSVTTNLNQITTNSTKSISSNSGSSSEQQSIESSLNEKENTFSDNKLDNSSNTMIETKAITSQEDQPIIQSHSARNIPKNPLFIPKSGSMNYPSAPKEPKKN